MDEESSSRPNTYVWFFRPKHGDQVSFPLEDWQVKPLWSPVLRPEKSLIGVWPRARLFIHILRTDRLEVSLPGRYNDRATLGRHSQDLRIEEERRTLENTFSLCWLSIHYYFSMAVFLPLFPNPQPSPGSIKLQEPFAQGSLRSEIMSTSALIHQTLTWFCSMGKINRRNQHILQCSFLFILGSD